VFGIIRFDGAQVAEDVLKKMGAAMQLRGPDGIRQRSFGAVGLGHCLMRVNREDRFERQPTVDRDLTLVADARIDNREAIASELGIAPASLERMADSEVILAAYRAWGPACADRLLGDFVFAIWDGARQQLCIGRDPIGLRGIHWYHGHGFAAFATEAKGLMALHEVPRELDGVRLMRSLVRDFRSGENSSLMAGVSTIPGGTVRTIALDGSVADTRYWHPQAAPEHEGRDTRYYHETYRHLISEAIACRVRRLVDPPGLLLSGGFDSAIIAGLARDPAETRNHRVLAVTSALAPDAGTTNERAFDARRGAQWCRDHMPHLDHDWWVQSDESPFDRGGATDHVADDVPLQLGFVFEGMYRNLRRRGARTAFDGIGGDETVNPRVPSALASLWQSRRLLALWREARLEARGTDISAIRLLIGVILPRWLRRLVRGDPSPDGIYWTNRYCAKDRLDVLLASGELRLPQRVQVGDRSARMSTLELLQSRARQNNANEAAAQGLELVRPLLDRRLIEFGLAIPDKVQRVDGRYRALARAALADVLPGEFATRPHSQESLLPQSRQILLGAAAKMREDLERWRERPELWSHIEIERMMTDLEPERVQRADAVQLAVVARIYLTARYIAWFHGLNS
jgi:asparagine synthase (glutamine-hydrolysing)